MALQNGPKIATEERRSLVIQMKIAGMSDRAIGEHFGVSRKTINLDVKRRLEEVRKMDKEAVQQEHTLRMEQYSTMLRKYWPIMLNARVTDALGNPRPAIYNSEECFQAGKMCVDILRRMDIICGLIPDKPLVNWTLLFQQNNYGEGSDAEDPRAELGRILDSMSVRLGEGRIIEANGYVQSSGTPT